MRKFGLVSFLALGLAAFGAAACGDDDGNTPDATVLPPDGGGTAADAPPMGADAMVTRGDIEDFFDPQGRNCTVDNDCKNPESHCRPIPYLQGMPKQCIPPCAASTDCPFNTVCYKTNNAQFVFMKDHCWISLCGPFNMNGTTSGACQLGVDSFAGLTNGPADRFPGWCYPISDDEFGQCLEAGNVPVGGTCDFTTQTRDGLNCDSTSLCVGQQGNPQGRCAKVCDPKQILTGGNPGCPAMEECFDSSNYITDLDFRQTIAFCLSDIKACATIADNTCPNDASGNAQGCAPTNPLRPTGICDPSATGLLPANAPCTPGGMGAANQCTAGTLCYGAGGTTTCEKICDIPAAMGTPVVDCAAALPGSTCKSILWDAGDDMTPGTMDDTRTADWGACEL